ncbi:MAG: hypothetical protein KF744_08870 [Taibaiella sp.]|nr:hypothetical protein [Taibaiella sp.]
MNLKKWVLLAFVNLLIVSVLGVILRYKIAFSLAFIDQKKLLHGHSHFAFSGWVSLALMAFIVSRLSAYTGQNLVKRYNRILVANLICAYGMLVSFPIQGYGLFSILFSTTSLFVSYWFAIQVWRDINNILQKSIALLWFKAATLFNALASIGAFALAFMMATKTVHQTWYLGSVYFFLHFQYNGWFSFTILGLLFEKLQDTETPVHQLKKIFWLFALSCGPAFFLSALWLPIPSVVYFLVVLAAVAQVAAWIWTIKVLYAKRIAMQRQIPKLALLTLKLSLFAMTIKLFLQLGSTIPSLSDLAFGFRPIVIGYLHLVLLGFTSLFILGYAMYSGIVPSGNKSKIGIIVFISGIFLNEIALMVQGVAAMSYTVVPYINEALLVAAVVLFAGLLVLNISFRKNLMNTDSMTLQ